jgi:hypothetical protein
MLLSGIVSLLLATVSATDTSQKRVDDAPILVAVQASADSLAAAVARFDAMSSIPRPARVLVRPASAELIRLFPADTPRTRPRAVEVSDWYNRRLTVHRYLSYSVIPIFAVQYMAGRQLWDKGRDAPDWAKTTHRAGATALAGIFTVNTVTGVWNLWDSRSAPQGRALRTFHAITMLAADAGFTYAGAKLSQEAETSLEKRRQHRTLALSSMGLAIVSGVAMKLFNQ